TCKVSFSTLYCFFTATISMIPGVAMRSSLLLSMRRSIPASGTAHSPAQLPSTERAGERADAGAHRTHQDDAHQDLVHLEGLASVDHEIADARARRQQVFGADRGQPGIH